MSNILEFAKENGLNPKRVSSSKGGEYHSPCPGCGGEDRFIIWVGQDRFYCRQCEKTGDVIQYLIEFSGFSYCEACTRLKIPFKSFNARKKYNFNSYKRNIFVPEKVSFPNKIWREKAAQFIEECHGMLLKNTEAMDLLKIRGITFNSIKKFKLGWNQKTFWKNALQWNIEGDREKIWFPKGIVIPCFHNLKPVKIKIRRSDWVEEDKLAKYIEIPGRMPEVAKYGLYENLPVLILESELDAILVQQFAGDICSCIALGGATKKPGIFIDTILRKAPFILFSLDYDKVGILSFRWWQKNYDKIILWFSPIEKSAGDAYKAGIDLRKWIKEGVDHAKSILNNGLRGFYE